MMEKVLLDEYLTSLTPSRDLILREMEQEAKEDKIPIANPEVAAFLALLVKIHKSKNILEIGTATGYSTIWMARAAAFAGGKVTTIEMNHIRHRRAREYFQRAGLEKNINALLGDALEILPRLDDRFDFIFIDAAKGQYLGFFAEAYKLLAPGGILVADNVLFRGFVATGSKYPRRKRTLIVRLRNFLKLISNHPNLKTSIIPLGDGIAVCLKEGKDIFEKA